MSGVIKVDEGQDHDEDFATAGEEDEEEDDEKPAEQNPITNTTCDDGRLMPYTFWSTLSLFLS